MRLLPLVRKEASPLLRRFYCRKHNRTVAGCPHSGGPETCPVRRDCQAHTLDLKPLSGPAGV